MKVYTKILFDFDFTSNKEEIQDIILSGDYFRHNIVEWEVNFDE